MKVTKDTLTREVTIVMSAEEFKELQSALTVVWNFLKNEMIQCLKSARW